MIKYHPKGENSFESLSAELIQKPGKSLFHTSSKNTLSNKYESFTISK